MEYEEILAKWRLLWGEGKASEAIDLIERSLSDHSLAANPRAFVILALAGAAACNETGEYRRAYNLYREALDRVQDDLNALYGMARTCSLLNEEEQARILFRRCYEVCIERGGRGYIEQVYLKLLEENREFWAE